MGAGGTYHRCRIVALMLLLAATSIREGKALPVAGQGLIDPKNHRDRAKADKINFAGTLAYPRWEGSGNKDAGAGDAVVVLVGAMEIPSRQGKQNRGRLRQNPHLKKQPRILEDFDNIFARASSMSYPEDVLTLSSSSSTPRSINYPSAAPSPAVSNAPSSPEDISNLIRTLSPTNAAASTVPNTVSETNLASAAEEDNNSDPNGRPGISIVGAVFVAVGCCGVVLVIIYASKQREHVQILGMERLDTSDSYESESNHDVLQSTYPDEEEESYSSNVFVDFSNRRKSYDGASKASGNSGDAVLAEEALMNEHTRRLQKVAEERVDVHYCASASCISCLNPNPKPVFLPVGDPMDGDVMKTKRTSNPAAVTIDQDDHHYPWMSYSPARKKYAVTEDDVLL